MAGPAKSFRDSGIGRKAQKLVWTMDQPIQRFPSQEPLGLTAARRTAAEAGAAPLLERDSSRDGFDQVWHPPIALGALEAVPAYRTLAGDLGYGVSEELAGPSLQIARPLNGSARPLRAPDA